MLQTTARGLDGTICLAPDSRVASIPSPDVRARQLPANLLPQTPLEPKGAQEAVPRGGGICGVPREQETPQIWERKGKGKQRLLLTYQMSTRRRTNSCFQLLLKPEIRPHTIPIKQHNCRLPAHAWGRGTRTRSGHSCCHEEQWDAAEKRRSVQASGTTFAHSTA